MLISSTTNAKVAQQHMVSQLCGWHARDEILCSVGGKSRPAVYPTVESIPATPCPVFPTRPTTPALAVCFSAVLLSHVEHGPSEGFFFSPFEKISYSSDNFAIWRSGVGVILYVWKYEVAEAQLCSCDCPPSGKLYASGVEIIYSESLHEIIHIFKAFPCVSGRSRGLKNSENNQEMNNFHCFKYVWWTLVSCNPRMTVD
jgi:hypothetical protein